MLVVNPVASSSTPALRDAAARRLRAELKLDVEVTQAAGDAGVLARQAAEDGLDAVVVLGGDGTLNEVVNGVLADGVRPGLPAVGVVPGGSANVFARAAGLSGDPEAALDAAVRAVRDGRRRRVGLGRADDRYFTFGVGLGLDAEVVEVVEAHRAAGRPATTGRYVRSALVHFFRDADRTSPPLSLETPDAEPVEGLFQVVVANTSPWTYLGPRAVDLVPDARFETGLDVFGLASLRVPAVLRTIAQGLRSPGRPHGRQVHRAHDLPSVVVRASRPVAVQVDGDSLPRTTEVRFTAVPSALDVLA